MLPRRPTVCQQTVNLAPIFGDRVKQSLEHFKLPRYPPDGFLPFARGMDRMRPALMVFCVAASAAIVIPWLRADEPPATKAKPVQLVKRHRLSKGHWMESRAVLSRTGRIDVHTRSWSNHEVAGFHGAVVVFLLDKNRNRLYSTEPRQYGVNATMFPGDDRTDVFHEDVPAEIIAQTDALVIQHLYKPENELLDRLKDAQAASRYLTGILRDGAEVILLGAVP